MVAAFEHWRKIRRDEIRLHTPLAWSKVTADDKISYPMIHVSSLRYALGFDPKYATSGHRLIGCEGVGRDKHIRRLSAQTLTRLNGRRPIPTYSYLLFRPFTFPPRSTAVIACAALPFSYSSRCKGG